MFQTGSTSRTDPELGTRLGMGELSWDRNGGKDDKCRFYMSFLYATIEDAIQPNLSESMSLRLSPTILFVASKTTGVRELFFLCHTFPILQ